jgi:hypothetical protein
MQLRRSELQRNILEGFDVPVKEKTWKQALADDWRKTKSWKPGWEFEMV